MYSNKPIWKAIEIMVIFFRIVNIVSVSCIKYKYSHTYNMNYGRRFRLLQILPK